MNEMDGLLRKDRATFCRLRGSGWLILPLLALLILLISPCPTLCARESEPGCQVEYTQGRLTVDATQVTLLELARRIQEETGIEFVVDKELGEEIVSVQILSLPTGEGLKRALGRFNYACIVGPDNSIARVVVIGKTHASPARGSGSTEAALPRSPGGEEAEDPGSAPAVMVMDPPSGEEMIVTYSADTMVVEPPLEEMVVTFAKTRMIVEQHPTDQSEMVITYPAGVLQAGGGN